MFQATGTLIREAESNIPTIPKGVGRSEKRGQPDLNRLSVSNAENLLSFPTSLQFPSLPYARHAPAEGSLRAEIPGAGEMETQLPTKC